MAKLGEDIINMYKPYRNHNAKWKVTTISKQRFEIYDKYEIIDVSTELIYAVGQGAYGIVVAAKEKTNLWPLRRSIRPSNTKYLPNAPSVNSASSSSSNTRTSSISRPSSFPSPEKNSKMCKSFPM
jgi:hypothetical protein